VSLSQRRTLLLGRLRHRKTREREGLVLVEGVRAVAEALDAGAEIGFACASAHLDEVRGGGPLRVRLLEAGAEVVDVSDGELAALADTEHPQGIVAACREPRRGLAPARPQGRVLLLDAIQDPGNVGTLARAAVAFDLDALLVLDGTADPWGPKAVRASAGMLFRLPVVSLDAAAALALLAERGVELLVADARGTDVAGFLPGPVWALAVGNEGAGVREDLRLAARSTLAIGMPGPAESLNAGVAGAILLYALTREGAR
jgi:RNA methyltransferase, TrmH family